MQRDAMMRLDVVHPNAAGIDIGNAGSEIQTAARYFGSAQSDHRHGPHS